MGSLPGLGVHVSNIVGAVPTTAAVNSESGEATWYSQAPPDGCASPTLPFGTALQIVNDATGASTTCVVDDREGNNPGRIIDLSYSGFSSLADPSLGVINVTIYWVS